MPKIASNSTPAPRSNAEFGSGVCVTVTSSKDAGNPLPVNHTTRSPDGTVELAVKVQLSSANVPNAMLESTPPFEHNTVLPPSSMIDQVPGVLSRRSPTNTDKV